MAGYIGSKASVVSSGAENKKVFDITTTTTSLTGLVYTPTLVHVFHNGVRLVDGTDYTATSGTTITLTVAAENGDQVVVISYATFQTSDTVSASAGGTFGNNVSVTGTLAATAVTGDGSGLTSLTSANLTGALPAISGAALTSLSAPNLTGTVASARMPAGSVLQVAQARKTDTTWSTASTSFVAVTGLSVTLTPASASSKFLVTVGVSIGSYWWGTGGGYFGVFADATLIAGDGSNVWVFQYGADANNSVDETMQWSEEVLHSPNTTSPVTFSVKLATGVAPYSMYLNRTYSGYRRGNSWITAREIAG